MIEEVVQEEDTNWKKMDLVEETGDQLEWCTRRREKNYQKINQLNNNIKKKINLKEKKLRKMKDIIKSLGENLIETEKIRIENKK